MKKTTVAICYDFDKTLSPDDMQTFTLIPSFGMQSEEFWKESVEVIKEKARMYSYDRIETMIQAKILLNIQTESNLISTASSARSTQLTKKQNRR